MSSELLMQEYLRRCAQEKGGIRGLKKALEWEENSQSGDEGNEYDSSEEEEENSNEYTMASRSPGRIQYQR